ncbi:MAG: hypothetical protein QXH30_00200 [Candidatus Bilamarchaeaceae archaeon]
MGAEEYFTFGASKDLPVHRWFYYKEGYAPQIAWHFIDEFRADSVFDPFVGVGTTLLASKERGIRSIGIDVSPLAVFVSRVKCADYSLQDIEDAKAALRSAFQERKEPSFAWDFELFSPRKFFSRRAYNDICHLRERAEEIENEKAGALFLLALLSILPQVGFFIKDGGVLREEKSKRAMPVKDAFRRKMKQIISDLESSPIVGPAPEVRLADARDFSEGEADAFITSPPYLNNIDYSKVYGLELSLLEMDKDAGRRMRERAVRSFITKEPHGKEVPPEAADAAARLPLAGEYFADMERVLQNLYKISKRGGVFVVGNAMVHEQHIAVDEILMKIAERVGFRCSTPFYAERTADVKPAKARVRESAVVFRK